MIGLFFLNILIVVPTIRTSNRSFEVVCPLVSPSQFFGSRRSQFYIHLINSLSSPRDLFFNTLITLVTLTTLTTQPILTTLITLVTLTPLTILINLTLTKKSIKNCDVRAALHSWNVLLFGGKQRNGRHGPKYGKCRIKQHMQCETCYPIGIAI